MNIQELLHNFLIQIGNLLPGVLGAILVLILGWLIASGVSKLVYRILKRVNIDNKLLNTAKTKIESEKLLSKLVYYLIMVLVLMVVLEILGVSYVLDPLKNMLSEFMSYLPNLVGAGVIGFIGFILASTVSELVRASGSLMTGLTSRLKVENPTSIIDMLSKVVFVIIFVPLLIVALDTLNMDSISDPAKEMLSEFINAIPNIIAAVLIIGFFTIAGKFISEFLGQLLQSLGVNNLASRLNLQTILGSVSASKVLANLAYFFIVFVGLITGIERLGFTVLTDILNNLFELSGQIFFAVLILAIGNFFAGLVFKALSASGNTFMASVARYGILGLFIAISLRTIGVAPEIVNLAFGLTLGSIAVAVALSFGLGGREAAGKQMDHFLKKFRNEQ